MTHTTASPNGILYVVATPIGNRGDITYRAIEILKAVDCIAAEDTRHSRAFLTTLGIGTHCVALHAHNEDKMSERLIERLKKGESIALISDAGTPLIRDPGYPLVKLAHEANIQVSPIPGACALIAALSAAGVPSDAFTFGGFLPATSSARVKALDAFKRISHTLVFYESTHRLLDALNDLADVFGSSAELVLVKELTKTFETFKLGSIESVLDWVHQDLNRKKGEFVLILPPRVSESSETAIDTEYCLKTLLAEMPVKKAVQLVSKLTGEPRNALYAKALQYQS